MGFRRAIVDGAIRKAAKPCRAKERSHFRRSRIQYSSQWREPLIPEAAADRNKGERPFARTLKEMPEVRRSNPLFADLDSIASQEAKRGTTATVLSNLFPFTTKTNDSRLMKPSTR
jgi:hypothetical protein